MAGFRFYNPEYLLLLLLIPILVLLFKYQKNKTLNKVKAIFTTEKLNYLLKNYSLVREKRALVLQLMGLFFIILSLARPQTLDGIIKVNNEGSEIILMVDVSRSMLAQDLKPSRLEIAKKELTRLVDMSIGDRFGLIAFAGSAVLLSPVTADKDAIKMYIESLDTNTVSTQGTNLTKAFHLAERSIVKGSLSNADSLQTVVSQSIIVASDGESHEKGTIDKVKELFGKNIKVFTLAFGTVKGAPIPVYDRSGQLRGYLTDKQGQTVMSQVKGEALRDLAEAGGGDFYQFRFESDIMKQLSNTLSQLEKLAFNEGELKTYGELFVIFLPLAFFFLLYGALISKNKKTFNKWRGRFETAK